MLEVSCDLYARGHLVAGNLRVWLHAHATALHEGRFHVPANLDVLTGAKYHLEVLGEMAKQLEISGGHSMDILISEVSGGIAYFSLIPPVG